MELCSSSSNPNAHTFDSPHPVYGMAFSPSSSSSTLRLALGSFIEDYSNRVDLISFDEASLAFRTEPSLSFDHPYPATKLMFHPRPIPGTGSSLLASSGDLLRLWQVPDVEGSARTELRSVCNNSKASEFCAPLTSFDWNPFMPERIGTSSIDTTCTIWDIEQGAVETQLIAHDKEVFDIAWGEADVFASCSADGSVRVFDLRDKEHSTIIYESPRPDMPLIRLAWNKANPRHIASILMDSSRVVILDIRQPAVPVAELQRHKACVNAIAWAPQTPTHLCSVGDDGHALIWDVPALPAGQSGPVVASREVDPVLAYSTGVEINQLQWSKLHPDWVGIAFANKVQLLRL